MKKMGSTASASRRAAMQAGSRTLRFPSDAATTLLSRAVRLALLGSSGVLCLGAGLITGLTVSVGDARAAAFPAVFELRNLHPLLGGDGTGGVIVKGIDAYDGSGDRVADAGDVNGDGIDDLLIGAVGADSHGDTFTGESYVVFGRATGFPAAFELRGLFPSAGGDGSEGFVLKGIQAFDYSAHDVSAAGDVNGDGIDDVIIGAPRADRNGRINVGESYVVFGRTTGFPAAFELRSLYPTFGGDGSEGFAVRGIDYAGHAGNAVSRAGDVNGDGVDDLLIAAYIAGADPYTQGHCYVVFGRTTGFPPIYSVRQLLPDQGGAGGEGVIFQGIDTVDHAGRSVSGAGDVNGDGIDDVLIGSSNAQDNAGESYVVFGRTAGFPALFPLRRLLPSAGGDGSEGFVLRGIDGFDFAGYAVGNAGDVNGDGIDDLLIGAHGAGRAGESYVVFGRTTRFPALFELRDLQPEDGGDGSTGFILRGIKEGDESGISVSGAGDLNDDGIADLVIGADLADPGGRSLAGEGYVVYGRTTAFPPVFELLRLRPVAGGDASEGFVLDGGFADGRAGTSVSGAGDVNSDGIDDLLISAPGFDSNGVTNSGVTYVVFGRAATPR